MTWLERAAALLDELDARLDRAEAWLDRMEAEAGLTRAERTVLRENAALTAVSCEVCAAGPGESCDVTAGAAYLILRRDWPPTVVHPHRAAAAISAGHADAGRLLARIADSNELPDGLRQLLQEKARGRRSS